MDEPGETCAIRYGWNARAVGLVPLLAPVVAVGFVPGAVAAGDGHSEWAFVPLVAAFLLLLSTRRVAVGIGPTGITPGRAASLDGRRFLPWSAIASLGLHLTPGAGSALKVLWRETDAAPPPSPAGSPAPRAIDGNLDTQVEPDFVAAFRGTTMSAVGMDLCKVDAARLRTAILAFAPEVRLFGAIAR